MTAPRRLWPMLGVAFAAACSADAGSSFTPGDGLVRFVLTNDLVAPITLSVDDTPYVALVEGASSGVAIRVSARRVTWISAKPTDAEGTPIPDDIDTTAVSVGGIQSVLEVTNIINGETYFTGRLFNRTTAQAAIGIFNGASVACVAILPAASGRAPGFVLFGYYRLQPATEVRAYRGSTCTGPYVPWPRSQIASPAPKSGSVTLILDTLP